MIYILFPAYNEEETIGKLIQRVIEFKKETGCQIDVIIVDDGSTDNTISIIDGFGESIPIKILKHEKNRGLGEVR